MKRRVDICAGIPAGLLLVLFSSGARAQGGNATTPASAQPPPAAQSATAPTVTPAPAKDTHISPGQAKELFRSVDQITKFASQDSGLPSKHSVKRRLTTRDEVERYINDRMKEDKDTQRVERSEIVLKKFGLLDRDFQLQPFLVSLLKEQIAGYYDSKTKTVNLLDWIAPEEQKPVLAHELTHALQDQHVDLDKWNDQSIEGLSHDVEDDNKHILTDEDDTARDAVAEGQAMAVFVDWRLRDKGVTLRTIPNIMANEENSEAASLGDSPVLARAPLLLQQSLLFPYQEGLNFEQVLLQDKGTEAAFAGALDRPPSSSYEIMNPRAYEKGKKGKLLRMPDIHPLIDSQYEPYDIGAMGELDVRMLTELFGGKPIGAAMAAQWDGGLYYAAQNKQAKTPEQKASTASVSIFYLSQWKKESSARQFTALYADSLNKKYSSVKLNEQESTAAHEQVFDTEEGPVLIGRVGKFVFVSESFELETARKLEFLLMNSQDNGQEENALVSPPTGTQSGKELTAAFTRCLAGYGLMRVSLRP